VSRCPSTSQGKSRDRKMQGEMQGEKCCDRRNVPRLLNESRLTWHRQPAGSELGTANHLLAFGWRRTGTRQTSSCLWVAPSWKTANIFLPLGGAAVSPLRKSGNNDGRLQPPRCPLWGTILGLYRRHGSPTNPRFTGLRCMYLSFSTAPTHSTHESRKTASARREHPGSPPTTRALCR